MSYPGSNHDNLGFCNYHNLIRIYISSTESKPKKSRKHPFTVHLPNDKYMVLTNTTQRNTEY